VQVFRASLAAPRVVDDHAIVPKEAAVGGGAGTGVRVFTKGKQVKIPSETRLDFTLQQPFDITYIPGRKSQRSSPDQSSGQPDATPNATSDQPPLN